jgi:NADH dehydrogenase (ubiquinone) 1 alpha subcomplex subunit 9
MALRRSVVANSRSLLARGFGTQSLMEGTEMEGRGGYSTDRGLKATIFGASGMLGRYVVAELASRGVTCYIPYRGSDMEVRHLTISADLGKMALIPFNVRDDDSIVESIRDADLVVNLMGKNFDGRHVLPWKITTPMREVHVTAARKVANIAYQMGVQQFIHVSALNASETSQSIWRQTKAEGEEAVQEAFPGATIVRPSVMFGEEDTYLNNIARMARSWPKFLLPNGGQNLVQPVFVHDVARAIKLMVQNPAAIDATYELAGPRLYSSKDVCEAVFRTIRHQSEVVDLPLPVIQAIAKVIEVTPIVKRRGARGEPEMTPDMITNRWVEDNFLIPDGECQTFEDLNIVPAEMEKTAFRFLHQYRMDSHFLETA